MDPPPSQEKQQQTGPPDKLGSIVPNTGIIHVIVEIVTCDTGNCNFCLSVGDKRDLSKPTPRYVS